MNIGNAILPKIEKWEAEQKAKKEKKKKGLLVSHGTCRIDLCY